MAGDKRHMDVPQGALFGKPVPNPTLHQISRLRFTEVRRINSDHV